MGPTARAELAARFAFNVGIDDVDYQAAVLPPSLPTQGRFVPGDAPVAERLAEVLRPPTLDQNFVESLRPTITDRSLLAPERYEDMSAVAESELRSAAAAQSDERSRRTLERAIDVLQEDQSLRSLLAANRHLLHCA